MKAESSIVPNALRSNALGRKRSIEKNNRIVAAEMPVICNALFCFNDKCPRRTLKIPDSRNTLIDMRPNRIFANGTVEKLATILLHIHRIPLGVKIPIISFT